MKFEETKVRQSNALTTARYKFSRTEKNVLYRILQEVRGKYEQGSMSEGNWRDMAIFLTSKDFAKIADENNTAHAKKALRELSRKAIDVADAEGNWLRVNFISYAQYDAKSKTYEVGVSRKIMPYFVELSKNYTTYGVTVAMALKSIYSQRFYELACMNRYKGCFSCTMAELREMLDLPSSYDIKSNFKRKVIDVAVNELKAFYERGESDLALEYVEKGVGLKTTFKFSILTSKAEDKEKTLEVFNHLQQKAGYILKRCQEIYPLDKKYSERVFNFLTQERPEATQKVFDKLTLLEKDKKGTDLAKLFRWVMREDYGVR